MVALYIHVPFCRARCNYCDFNTYTGLDGLLPDYVAALGQEISLLSKEHGPLRVQTLYFGGGTPSLLPLEAVGTIIEQIDATTVICPHAEITLEANPGTVSRRYLEGLRALGVNRLSIGAQSTRDEELRMLGRIHTWSDVVQTVDWARAAGFTNLSLDLIYGLPGQSLRHWRATLEATLALAPQHLSLYALTVEDDTPLAQSIATQELPAPDDDIAARMYELAEERLAEAGFFHYEISNWAFAPNGSIGSTWWPRGQTAETTLLTTEAISPFVCRHNLVYWRNEAWIGIGAGAHSWWGGIRWANSAHPVTYIAALRAGELPVAEKEEITGRLEMGETMMLGLRLAEGVNDHRFRARFGRGLSDVFSQQLTELVRLGLIEWDGQNARLTARGRLLGNLVFARFL